jgi:RNA polymerase sigma-70 factor (ECF subfamily)
LRQRTRTSWRDDSKTGENLPPPPDMAEVPDPAAPGMESVWEEEWQANLLKAALESVRHSVKEEHYQIFDLYVIKQWPATKVARSLGINVGLAYLVKYRLSALLKKEVRRLEKQWNQA